jgi:hypothetical protein
MMKGPLLQKIAEAKALNDESRAQLLAALKECKEKYLAERGAEQKGR